MLKIGDFSRLSRVSVRELRCIQQLHYGSMRMDMNFAER